MGEKFTAITEDGSGLGFVELLGPCESPVTFTGEKGSAPAKAGAEFRLGYITGAVGVGEPTYIELADGAKFILWSQQAQVTITDAGLAWYYVDGTRDELEVTEDPVRLDEFVLSKDGRYMGKVTLK